MNFLAVNAAGESVEVALKIDGREYVSFDPEYKKASEVLLLLIDKVFTEAGADISAVDFFACCVGPGSFTGIRIGLSTVRAFCQSLNKPALAVTNTLALSYNVSVSDESIVTFSDAGNGYVYAAVYDKDRNEILPPECISTADINEFLSGIVKPYSVCCDSLCAELVPNAYVRKNGGNALIRAVEHETARRGMTDYKRLIPLYVRKSQAETFLDGKKL